MIRKSIPRASIQISMPTGIRGRAKETRSREVIRRCDGYTHKRTRSR